MLIANYTDNESPDFSADRFQINTSARRDPGELTPLVASKLEAPRQRSLIKRAKLTNYAAKAVNLCGTLIIHGRAETGKTSLAAELAAQTDGHVAWYNVDSTDADWSLFYRYFSRSVRDFTAVKQEGQAGNKFDAPAVSDMLAGISSGESLMLVMDDVHGVFDADWFEGFFGCLLPLSNQVMKLVLVSRSEPPIPLWRMRSKQMLSVIDENLLAFTPSETIEYFDAVGLSKDQASAAHEKTFGRIGKLKAEAEKLAKEQMPDAGS
jgi:LuxR family transcriptional regulator, maltose regulon positive regulatory protein